MTEAAAAQHSSTGSLLRLTTKEEVRHGLGDARVPALKRKDTDEKLAARTAFADRFLAELAESMVANPSYIDTTGGTFIEPQAAAHVSADLYRSYCRGQDTDHKNALLSAIDDAFRLLSGSDFYYRFMANFHRLTSIR